MTTHHPARLFASVLLLAVAGITVARAQTVRELQLSILGHFLQTGTSTASLGWADFDARVTGENLGGIAAPTFTIGGGNLSGLTKTLTLNNGAWGYSTSNYAANGLVFQDYGSGLYPFTINGTTLNTLGLPSSILAPNIPLVSFSSGSWLGGQFLVDPSQALTISSNTFTSNYASGKTYISMNVFDPLTGQTLFEFGTANGLTAFTSNSVSTTLAPNTFLAGHTYKVELEFDVLVNSGGQTSPDLTTFSSGGVPYGVAYSSFGRSTSLTISAIPEPSSTATLAALTVAGVVMWRRRRTSTL